MAKELGVKPVRCGDPLSKVKEPIAWVEYLPEGIPFAGDDGAAAWIAREWFAKPGPWLCEGHVMARALRRWLETIGPHKMPCDQIIVLDRPGFGFPLPGQNAMHMGVMTVWNGIRYHYDRIAEYR
jgi:hypothetical protein